MRNSSNMSTPVTGFRNSPPKNIKKKPDSVQPERKTWGLCFHHCMQIFYVHTDSMEQGPSREANRFSATQEIPRILWNQKVHYRIHKCPPPVPNLNQIDPVHTLTCPFLKIHLLSSHLRLGLPSGFHSKPCIHLSTLPHICYMPHPPHSSQFDRPNNIRWGVQVIFTPPNSNATSVNITGLMESCYVTEHYFGCKKLAVFDYIQLRFLYKGSQIIFQIGLLPVMYELNITVNVRP